VLLAAALTVPALQARGAEGPDPGAQFQMLSHEIEGLRQQFAERVRVNGYFSLDYYADNRATSHNGFEQESFNLFVGRSWDRWRVLGEIEYEGGPDIEATGAGAQGNGAISAEVAWAEYRFRDALSLRGGKFLLPQYWNLNHYAPVVLSTTRPLMVRQVFPVSTVGLMAHGDVFPGAFGASYSAYYANGQTPDATDDNENKAVGGRVTAHLGGLSRALSRLDVSASGHSERLQALGGTVDILGGDLQLDAGRFQILAEYATATGNPTLEGFYIQPAARVCDGVRLFYRYDYLDDGMNPQKRHTLGLNWRPMANVSLKLEGQTHAFVHPGGDGYDRVAASVALFF
jgi:hypothetical protein